VGKKAALHYAAIILTIGMTTSSLYLYHAHRALFSSLLAVLLGVVVVGNDIRVAQGGVKEEEVRKAIDHVFIPMLAVTLLFGVSGMG